MIRRRNFPSPDFCMPEYTRETASGTMTRPLIYSNRCLLFTDSYVIIGRVSFTDSINYRRDSMISFIRGLVSDTTENSVILEAGGIGYEIFMTGSSIEQASRSDGEVKIHTYFHVREDAMQLYGFLSRDDLEMFRLLLNVNGIGPKAALGVLAGLTADELRFAVLSDDIKTISRAPGIGKKTAQKLILELKDKLKLEDAFEKKLAHEQEAADISGSVLHDGRQEAVEALVALGYSSTEAMKAVRKVTDVSPDDVEGLLKAALKLF